MAKDTNVHDWVRTVVTLFVFLVTMIGAIVVFNSRLVALEVRSQNFINKAAFTVLAKDIEFIKEKQEEILDTLRAYTEFHIKAGN